jgi:hypothetical protein
MHIQDKSLDFISFYFSLSDSTKSKEHLAGNLETKQQLLQHINYNHKMEMSKHETFNIQPNAF